MPLYEYRCMVCGHVFDDFSSVENRCNKRCISCGGNTAIVISAPAVIGLGRYPYYDKALGCEVLSYRDRQRIIKEKKLIEAGDVKHWDDVKPTTQEDVGTMGEFGKVWNEVTSQS